ncbi:MAG: hypothetical protein ABFS14_08835 [Gemmatimonadota bacterium]
MLRLNRLSLLVGTIWITGCAADSGSETASEPGAETGAATADAAPPSTQAGIDTVPHLISVGDQVRFDLINMQAPRPAPTE